MAELQRSGFQVGDGANWNRCEERRLFGSGKVKTLLLTILTPRPSQRIA